MALLKPETEPALKFKPPAKLDTLIARSHTFLYAQALELAKKPDEAKSVWKRLLPISESGNRDYLLAALARDHAATDTLIEIVRASSGFPDDGTIYLAIFRQYASESLLLQIAQDPKAQPMARQSAERSLLSRWTLRGEFGAFNSKIDSFSPESRALFEPVQTAMKTLGSKPSDPKALLNWGYFVQWKENAFELSGYYRPDCVKASRAAKETAESKPPLYHYVRALEAFDFKSRSETEAKLLNYLVKCFKTGENSRTCLWDREKNLEPEFPKSQRMAWFKRLKSAYKDTRWAKELNYYY